MTDAKTSGAKWLTPKRVDPNNWHQNEWDQMTDTKTSGDK